MKKGKVVFTSISLAFLLSVTSSNEINYDYGKHSFYKSTRLSPCFFNERMIKNNITTFTLGGIDSINNIFIGDEELDNDIKRVTSGYFKKSDDYNNYNSFIRDFNSELDNNSDISQSIHVYNIPYEGLLKKYNNILNKNELVNKIGSLKLNYIDKNDDYIKRNPYTLGYYSSGDNSISLNKDLLNLSDDDAMREVICHEFYHFILINGNREIYTTNREELVEGFNEMISGEALNTLGYLDTYTNSQLYCRLLLGVCSPTSCVHFAMGDDRYVVAELSKYIGDDGASELLDMMNRSCTTVNDNTYENNISEIKGYLNSIYYNKYNKYMDGDYYNKIYEVLDDNFYCLNSDNFMFTKKYFIGCGSSYKDNYGNDLGYNNYVVYDNDGEVISNISFNDDKVFSLKK